MIRLIASDLDGTLLEPVERLPEGLFETLEKLNQLGIVFAAASGRQYDNLRRLFAPATKQMGFICENGALSVLRGEVIGVEGIERSMALELVRYLQKMPVCILVSGRYTCYVSPENRAFTDDIIYRLRNTTAVTEHLDQLDDDYLKISAFSPDGVASFTEELQKEWGNRLHALVSGKCWFDFGTASKATGIHALMKELRINKDEVVAFGDQFNDVSMLDAVGHPFLMDIASDALKQRGYHLCSRVLPVLQYIADHEGSLEGFTFS